MQWVSASPEPEASDALAALRLRDIAAFSKNGLLGPIWELPLEEIDRKEVFESQRSEEIDNRLWKSHGGESIKFFGWWP